MIYWHTLLEIYLLMELNIGEGVREMGPEGCDVLHNLGDSVQKNFLCCPRLAPCQHHCAAWASVWAPALEMCSISQARPWVVSSCAQGEADSRGSLHCSSKHPSSKENDPPGRIGHCQETEEAQAQGQARPELRPHPVTAVPGASFLSWLER